MSYFLASMNYVKEILDAVPKEKKDVCFLLNFNSTLINEPLFSGAMLLTCRSLF